MVGAVHLRRYAKPVKRIVYLWTVICWYGDIKLGREQNRPLPNLPRTSSTYGMGSWPSMLILFSFLCLIGSQFSPDSSCKMTTRLAYARVSAGSYYS